MTTPWHDLIAVLAFALLCGGWVWLQRWVARTEPDVKGPERGGGCGACSCGGTACERGDARAP